MGMLDSLGNVIVKGVSDAFSPASLITGALGFLGGERRNQQQQAAADAANTFSAQQYATRYQTTVADMQKAGLNPMLAYQQGTGSAQPSGVMSQYQDTISPAVAAFQAQNLQESQQEANYGSAAQARANVKVLNETVKKTVQEVENLQTTNEQTDAMIKNLVAMRENMIAENVNIKLIATQIRAATNKMLKEIPQIDSQTLLNKALALQSNANTEYQHAQTDVQNKESQLKQLDLNAARSMGNIGRGMKEIKPVLDVLIPFLK